MLHRKINLAALLLAMLFATAYSRRLLTLDSTTAVEEATGVETASTANAK
jgi:hypothetical protein